MPADQFVKNHGAIPPPLERMISCDPASRQIYAHSGGFGKNFLPWHLTNGKAHAIVNVRCEAHVLRAPTTWAYMQCRFESCFLRHRRNGGMVYATRLII